ncbi:ABC transporter permease [Companilactobacillus ginsenosidimutans]|uniref:Permease n=1 Tax=Companilactobacillus ginsenosidimutans TaxID=1007676 RepID=A0A0H4QXT8_9LACO|nr:ABC transporter permease [Companilactobacillus ginsenosidimutans]AKP66290.1 permease [Companilactobacillus ginsenosidimutans]
MENLTIALRSIRKNKNRNLLTMLGIIIGIASVICILAVGDGFTQSITKSLGKDNASNKVTLSYTSSSDDANSKDGFTQGDASLLQDVPGVTSVKLSSYSDSTTGKLTYRNKKASTEITSIKDKTKVSSSKKNALISDTNSTNILLSNRMAKKLFGGDSAINKPVTIGQDVYTVSGTFGADEYDANVYMSKGTYNRIFNSQNSKNLAKLTLENGQNKKKVGKAALKKIKANGEFKHQGKYGIVDPTKSMKEFSKVLNSITYFVALVAGISLLIAGIGVMNVMYITVSERRNEIGIRRAFGATCNNIRNQFLTESIVLCVIGGILGIIIGYLAVLVINAFLPFKAVITIYSILLALIVSSAVGLLFGFIPSNKAAKSPLVGLLKEE